MKNISLFAVALISTMLISCAASPALADEKLSQSEQPVSERIQLHELWKISLSRNPDVQFVFHALQKRDPGHYAESWLDSCIDEVAKAQTPQMGMGGSFLALTDPSLEPNYPTIGRHIAPYDLPKTASAYSNIISGRALIHEHGKGPEFSDEERMIMENMIRSFAQKLVSAYRDYVKRSTSLLTARRELESKRALASKHHDASKQLEIDFALRKAQRDVDEINDDVRRYRKSLLDSVGYDAVRHLDEQSGFPLEVEPQPPIPVG